ncbi:uncharacterized protein LOC131694233 [Topomyia yanbarensis]|uniref:uncharacterized protein LOC131694233 n=1 Tax=Topomyia yanbarensis TaxID=2498891 RepID=UPI00273B647E|nr:uncharacterized protein LOC131694233 [Topomyia yanbarensis]
MPSMEVKSKSQLVVNSTFLQMDNRTDQEDDSEDDPVASPTPLTSTQKASEESQFDPQFPVKLSLLQTADVTGGDDKAVVSAMSLIRSLQPSNSDSSFPEHSSDIEKLRPVEQSASVYLLELNPETTVEQEPNWKAKFEKTEAENRSLVEKLKKLRKRNNMLEQQKLASDDLALRYSKKLLAIEDKQKIPMARFTVTPEFNITIQQLEEINGRCQTDSMFVGLLCIQLIGVERLKGMSVTGQPSHRFINAKNDNGSPIYKATEKIDPSVVEFICGKF